MDLNGNLLWQKAYGGSNGDGFDSIKPTSDGGYIVSGSTYSFGAGNRDIWIMKLDNSGTIIWQKTYKTANDEDIQSIQEITGGGYIAGCWKGTFTGNRYTQTGNALILKLDRTGNILWQKEYKYTNFIGTVIVFKL